MLLMEQFYEQPESDLFIPVISIIVLVIVGLLFAKRYNPIHALITLITLSGIITIGKEVMHIIGFFQIYDFLYPINEGSHIFFYYMFWLLSTNIDFSFITYTTMLLIMFNIFLISQIIASVLRKRAIKKKIDMRASINQQYAIGGKNSRNMPPIMSHPTSFYHPRFDYYTQLNQNQINHQQVSQHHIAQQQANHNQQLQAGQQHMNTNQQLHNPTMQSPFNIGAPATQKPMNLPISPQTKSLPSQPLPQQGVRLQSHGFSRPTQQVSQPHQGEYQQPRSQVQSQPHQLQVPVTQGYIQRQANTTPLSQGLNYQPQATATPNPRPRIPQGFRTADATQQDPRLMKVEYNEYDPKI